MVEEAVARDMPNELRRLTDEVLERVRFLSANPVADAWDTASMNADTYNVVSILGLRGSGKSTVLRAVCAELGEDQDYLVLPVLRPELFTEAQSVIASAMATIVAVVNGRKPNFNISADIATNEIQLLGETLQLRSWANRLLRNASALGQPPSGTIESALEDYVSDASKASGAAIEFDSLWSEFASALLEAVGAKYLVIAIDDADLAVQGFGEVLRSIRWLANVRNVAVLIAADQDEARRTLLADQLASKSAAGEPDLVHAPKNSYQVASLRIVDGQLAKVMPTDGRVFVPEMQPLDCLNFAPLNESFTLLDQMRRLVFESTYRPIRSLGDFFGHDVDGELETTWLASALPTNPRELTALYRVLKRHTGDKGTRPLPLSVIGFLLEMAIQHGIRRSGLSEYWSTDFFTQQTYSGGRLEFSADLEGLRARPQYWEASFYLNLLEDQIPNRDRKSESDGHRSGGYTKASSYQTSSNGMRLALPGPSFYQFEIMSSPNSEVDRRKFRKIDESLSAAFSLISEFHEVLPHRGNIKKRGDSKTRRGGINFAYYIECEGTDDRFLLVPNWPTTHAGWLFYRGWGEIMRAAGSVRFSRDKRSLAMILDAWRLILWVDSEPEEIDLRPHFTARSSEPTLDEAQGVLRDLSDRYQEAISRTGGDANDFIEWFEEFLVQSLHPWLLGEDDISFLWATWREAVDLTPRREIAYMELSGLLKGRIGSNLGSEWVAPLIAVLAQIDQPGALALAREDENARRLLDSNTTNNPERVDSSLFDTSDLTSLRDSRG